MLPVQIFHGLDFLIIAFYNNRRPVIGIGRAEIIFLLPLFRDIHAVYHDIIPSGVKPCKQSVPLALNKACRNSQLLCNQLRHLNVISHKIIVFVMIGPGRPCPFHGNDNFTLFLNLRKQIFACRPGSCFTSRSCVGTGAICFRCPAVCRIFFRFLT